MEWLCDQRWFSRPVNRFYRRQNGGLAIIFAILLPFIFSCCALVFDGSRLLIKRARLADALNEAALVIATASTATPDEDERLRLKNLLDKYVNAYLPGEQIKSSDITISYYTDPQSGSQLPVFDIQADINVKTMLPLDNFPAFAPQLSMTNSGKVRKGLGEEGTPADYIFVVDFSGSMNFSSAEAGLTRLQLLKKVVNDISIKALDAFPESTFALVPFEIGVPVLWDNTVNKIGENELSDKLHAVTACSVLMVPNKAYHSTLTITDEHGVKMPMPIGYDIDYAFWANKSSYALSALAAPSNSATTLPYTIPNVQIALDTGRYRYFDSYVLPSLKRDNPSASWQTMINDGWCSKQKGPSYPLYSCEKSEQNSVYNADNEKIIKREIERARRVAVEARNNSILNITAMDIEATLDGMFDPANIITFPMAYGRGNFNDNNVFPYGDMCQSSGHLGNSANALKDVQPNSYLIEATNDRSVLDKFQTMTAKGGTHSSTGLLRAVPELRKGNNTRKAIIVVSDGEDTYEYQPVTDSLHKNRSSGQRICDRIRNDAKTKLNAEVEIYFISLIDDASGRQRTKYWADYCTGADNAIVATNYADIMDKLIAIMNQYEETGYFYN